MANLPPLINVSEILSKTFKKPSTSISKNNISELSTSNSDIKALMRANGIYDRLEMDWYRKFSRFGIIDPYNTLTRTKEYIFITKPDLPLLDSSGNVNPALSNNAFFVDAIRRYKNIAAQLQSSYKKSNNCPFMTVLSNSVTSTLDIPGISADMIESASNIIGTKISYRGTSVKSDEDHDFNLEFEDNKYLDIYMLFKMYDEYEKLKWNGAIDFIKAGDRWKNYIINKVLHDQVTIYKFIVGDDGYRIVYWARITGCVPTSIPRDAFSNMDDCTPQKLTVGWKGHFVRDMDPIIISQFNSLVEPYVTGKQDLPLFNSATSSMNGNWSSMPYIDIQTVNDQYRSENNRREYFLRWAK